MVYGTLVYSKGDEEGVRREAAEAMAVQVRGTCKTINEAHWRCRYVGHAHHQ